jgi:putative transposase
MAEFHERSRPARGLLSDDAIPTLIFLTVCTRGRSHWLADDRVHAMLQQIWSTADKWKVGPYVLMPNHVHLFAWPGSDPCLFDPWVKYWKSRFTAAFRNPSCRWQKYSFHHRIRSHESAEARWQYIRNNPVRAGLVEHAEAWPYQGEIFKASIWW